jgi:hypothetical protein
MGHVRTFVMVLFVMGVVAGTERPAHAISTGYYMMRALVCITLWNGDNAVGATSTGKASNAGQYTVGRLVCDIKVPDDATITRFRVYGEDTDTSSHMTFRLLKAQYNIGTAATLSNFTSDDSGANNWASATLNEPVNNDSFVYWVVVDFPSTQTTDIQRVWTIEITYNQP